MSKGSILLSNKLVEEKREKMGERVMWKKKEEKLNNKETYTKVLKVKKET